MVTSKPITNNILKKSYLTVIITLLGCLLLSSNSCNDDNDTNSRSDNFNISKVSIPSTISVIINGDITLDGKGFEPDDQILLVSSLDPSLEYLINVKSVTEITVTFTIPSIFSSGNYKIAVVRDNENLYLGTTLVNITADIEIPDIDGMTVKGIVHCDGIGINGVVVSDGEEVTTTDANGIYYLPSNKSKGYVFISIPGNYETATTNNIPQFFQMLAGGSSVEQKDFSLIKTDNNNHIVITMADWHLADRNNDLAQFSNGFLKDVNSTINEYEAAGTKVYGLTLGDMSWDMYWYENNFGLPGYLTQMKNINCSVFNVMGNHDNDPYCSGDWIAEDKFRDLVSPTYYSFNLGKVHYIVLDDTEYTNIGGIQGTIGDREYNDIIVADQMAWLEKDLATITDKTTPIVVAMHIQLYNNPTLDANKVPISNITLNNGSTFISSLKDFSNVHLLTGHTHINYSVESGVSLMEHNTAAVCATWWWTGKSGYAGNHICKDGTPGGYGVWKMNNTDLSWYYKSIGYDKDYQFRTYDLNKILITAQNFAPNSTDDLLAAYAGEYATQNSNNEVLINVWNYDTQWTIEVKEGDKPLDVERVYKKDPLHIISYSALRLNIAATPTSSFESCYTSHMFKVTASSATSTLNITVTDRFGNKFTQTMTRPKEFTYLMK